MTNWLTTFPWVMIQALSSFVDDFHHVFLQIFSIFHHRAGLAAILCLETFDCFSCKWSYLWQNISQLFTSSGWNFTITMSFWRFCGQRLWDSKHFPDISADDVFDYSGKKNLLSQYLCDVSASGKKNSLSQNYSGCFGIWAEHFHFPNIFLKFLLTMLGLLSFFFSWM